MSSRNLGAGRAVTTTKDGPHSADDISQLSDDSFRISPISSASRPVVTSSNSAAATAANGQTAPTGKRRYRLFLKVLQKINMVFLVLFVCYFVWTISANYASNHGNNDRPGNITNHINATHQVKDIHRESGDRYIPYLPNKDNTSQDDVTYHTNVVIPDHRKHTKKRRKKGRGKKRNRRLRNKHNSRGRDDEYLNLTAEPHKNRKDDRLCKNCKIKKRKSRNRFHIGRIKASTLRRILEKVADDTLSGARSGDGTFINLRSETGNQDNGWSTNQKVVDVNLGDTDGDDYSHRKTDESRTDHSTTAWTSWSSCSATCGAGQRERMRNCGAACREVESMVCIRPSCKDSSSSESLATINEFYKWEKEGFVPPLRPPKQEFLDPNVDACTEWVKCSKDFAHEYLTNSSLPGCPCFYPLKRDDSKEIHDVKLDKTFVWDDASGHSDLVYKPEARVCIRSRLSPGAVTLAVQHCCYDGAYTLVTRGKSAGTPNLISVDISKELHYKLDLLPWIICKGDWTRYNQVLPPDNQLECQTNPDDFTVKRQKQQVKIY